MTENAFRQIERETEAAKRGIMPDALVSAYGNKPPAGREVQCGHFDARGRAAGPRHAAPTAGARCL